MGGPAESPMIVWDVDVADVDELRQAPLLHSVGLEPSRFGHLVLRLHALRLSLRPPSFDRHHCDGPMETTRRLDASADVAAATLDRVEVVAWDSSADAGRLHLEPFRAAPDEPGNPWVSTAVLRGRRTRRVHVSISIFAHGGARCGIEIRPLYRRPWSRRRLRRCLTSTHCAADRLRAFVLATDFQPVAA